MKLSLKITIGTLLASLAFLSLFFITNDNNHTVQAFGTDNVFGQAWGATDGESGIGWVSLNNCDNNSPQTCTSVGYGVNIDTTTGQFSGAGWSSNYGWVDFNANNSCPLNVNNEGVHVNFQSIIDSGEAYITGYAHVYNAPDDGFWGWMY